MNEKAPFPFDDESRMVMRSFMRDALEKLEVLRETYVDARNVHSFSHGTSWQSHNSYAPDRVSHLQTQSHDSQIPFEDVLMGRLEVIPESLTSLVDSMMDGFGRSFFQTLSQVCEENDRVIPTAGSLGEQFIAALDSVEFSVGRDGSIQKPQMMVGTEVMNRIRHDPSLRSAELQAKAQMITELKSAQALEREAARKAKFVKGVD